MIRIKDHNQMPLFDPWQFLSPKRRRLLDQGWPGLFREHLLRELPVDKIRPFLTDGFGAPSKELYTLLGVLLLQQTMDLNDAQCVEQLSFNIQWHYALNITEDSDQAKYISEKSLWHWRQVLTEHGLDQLIFDKISAKLAKVFDVNTDEQRIDSVHIKSNMRKLGRIGLIAQSISKFLVNLKRHHRNLFATVNDTLAGRYGSKKSLAAFSQVKPSEAAKTLVQVSSDLYDLIAQFKNNDAVCAMHSYKLMQRVLSEQCDIEPDENNQADKIVVKKPKQIPADSVQNPCDPDAAYSGYKGQGYQVQVMESFTRSEDKQEKAQRLDLITHVAVEKACEHDSNALLPAIDNTERQGLKPKTILADTLYGGDDNTVSAKAHDVELVSPTFKKENNRGLHHFSFNDQGRITRCRAGHSPVKVVYKKKTQRFSARFDLDQCTACPHVDQCPAVPGKNNYFVRYSDKDHRLAVRRRFEASDQFVDIYRWRAGVEATMSQYDRLTGVKHLRVRGLKAVRYCAILKAAGLNMLRAAAVAMARNRAKEPAKGRLSAHFMPYPFVKERIDRFCCGIAKLLLPNIIRADGYLKLAA